MTSNLTGRRQLRIYFDIMNDWFPLDLPAAKEFCPEIDWVIYYQQSKNGDKVQNRASGDSIANVFHASLVDLYLFRAKNRRHAVWLSSSAACALFVIIYTEAKEHELRNEENLCPRMKIACVRQICRISASVRLIMTSRRGGKASTRSRSDKLMRF